MFVYEKIVDGERTIYGCRGKIPSDADMPVTYTDGDEIILDDVVYEDTYLDASKHQMRRTSDDSLVEMWISDDEPEDINVIPGWKEGPIGKRLKITCSPVTDPSIDLFGKNCDDLQSNIVIGKDSVTGLSKYVLDYTGFSSKPEEQEGNYIAVKFTANEGATIKVNGVTLEDDGIFVAIIPQDAEEPKLIAVASCEGFDDKELVVNLKDLTREPVPPFFYYGAKDEQVTSIDGLNRIVIDIDEVASNGITISIPCGVPNPEDPSEGRSQFKAIAIDKSLKLDEWKNVEMPIPYQDIEMSELENCNLAAFTTATYDPEGAEVALLTFIPAN